MSVTFFSRLEALNLDSTHDFSAGDTTGSTNGTPTFDPAGARVGTNGLVVNGSAERVEYDTASLIEPALGGVGIWVRYVASIPVGGVASCFFARGSGSTNDHVHLYYVNSGTDRFLRFGINQNGGTGHNLQIDTTALADTWYFVMAFWDSANDYREVRLYDTSGALLDSAVDSSTDFTTSVPAALSFMRLGDIAGSTVERHLDNIFLCNAQADLDVIHANREITSWTDFDLGGESYTGTGAATIAAATSSGAGHRGLQDQAGPIALNFRGMTLAGSGTVTASGPAEITGTGALTINSITIIDATGLKKIQGSGALAAPKPTIVGLQGPRSRIGDGALVMGQPAIVAGVGVRHITGTGALNIARPIVNGVGPDVTFGEQVQHRAAHKFARKRAIKYAHGRAAR